ncbi:MAG: glycosyltransferase [bacterium]
MNMKFTGERFIPDSGSSELTIEHYQRYLSLTNLIKNKVVVDAACGEGYGSSILSKYATYVYGVDINQETILHAREKYSDNKNTTFILASVTNIPLQSNSVDIFVSFETIEHIDEQSQELFLSEIKRLLKKDGILIISTPDKSLYSDAHGYSNEFHIKEFYKDEFNKFLLQFFNYTYFYYQDFQVASVLTSNQSTYLRPVYATSTNTGKYIIALCSDINEIHNDIASIVYDIEGRHLKDINRILELQQEVESFGKWIQHLNTINKSHEETIESRQYLTEILSHDLNTTREKIKETQIMLNQRNKDLKHRDVQLEKKNKELSQAQAYLHSIKKQLNQREKELRCKDAQLEEKNNELCQAHNNINILIDWFSFLEDDIQVLIKSMRWRLGSAVIGIIDFFTLRYGKRTAIDHINSILRDYKKWRLENKIQQTNIVDLHVNTHTNSQSTSYNLIHFIRGILLNPKYTFKLMNITRIKNFFITLFHNDKSLKESVYRYYIDQLSKSRKTNQDIHFGLKATTKRGLLRVPYFQNIVVSIIIPVFNNWHYTYNCVNSIIENTKSINYEIIIVDDNSRDATKQAFDFIENLIVIRNKCNLGFIKNCNNAAKKAKGKYIVFLHNDTVVQDEWLDKLVTFIEKHDDIGIVGPKIINKNGTLQQAGGIVWKDGTNLNYGQDEDFTKPEYNYVKEVDYIANTGILIRKDLWNEIGGFHVLDKSGSCEHIDLAFEARKRTYKVLYQPGSVLLHLGKACDFGQNSDIAEIIIRNREKFVSKWSKVLEKEHCEKNCHIFYSRDRSRNKKTILFIDHYVPFFDKDAGSKSTFQYIKLFIKNNFNVKFLGDNFFQHEPYTSILQNLGVEVLYGQYYAKHWQEWLRENSQYIDYIYMHRPHISIKYIDFCKNHLHAKILYQCHDLHFLRKQREYEVNKNKKCLKEVQYWENLERELFGKADVALTFSADELEIIREKFPGTNCCQIPLFFFDKFEKYNTNFALRKHFMYVGGFGHPPNVDAVLWFVKKVFPKVLENRPETQFLVIGSNPPEEVKELADKNVKLFGYVSNQELHELYCKVRLQVIPLRYGAGVKGKVIESLYYGLPLVTTHVGIEGMPDIEEIIHPIDSPKDMAQEIIRLMEDNKACIQASARYQEYVKEHFSEKVALASLMKVL